MSSVKVSALESVLSTRFDSLFRIDLLVRGVVDFGVRADEAESLKLAEGPHG